ncbi:insulinase family protein [Alkalinema sp. FACHB-956]|uniref:insulinase family protein n=1 Tax=Alkalinema sp. FACHB-956 TaxID=2692768 RepID=UPI001684C8EC|nr:insulinase family protein [Alkalinema sp. FACHB-956]
MTQTIDLAQNRSVYRTVLSNGIVVLVTENPAADIIAARLFLKGGHRSEAVQQAGLCHLLSSVITKGTLTKSSMQIAEQVETVGASLGVEASSDYFITSVKTVSGDFSEIFALAGEILRSPSFPEAEVELERKLTLQAILSQQEQPFAVAMEKLRQALYGNHPYAYTSLSTAETIATITAQDLHHYHKTWFRPDHLVISIAGRIDPQAAIAQVESVFGDWAVPTEPQPTVSLPDIVTDPTQMLTPQETQQSIVMLGYLAPAMSSNLHNLTDFSALKLLCTYLGNGLSSRLFVELREKRGLAYDVSAFYPTRLETSHFVAYMGTAPENTQIAVDGLKTEIDRLASHTLSTEELQTAKNKVLGQYALGKQTNGQIAQTLGWYEFLGVGVDFDRHFPAAITAITPEIAQAAAQRWFGQPCLSLLGPEAWITL